ncbi:MAG: nickel-responsive transcriptional regulator NikR [Nanoarchaeota archaeon]
MEKINRKSIAFEPNQLKEFDKIIKKHGYNNRSQAIRDLIRNYLIEQKINDPNSNCIGTLTFIYDHDHKDIQRHLTHLQHHYDVVKSTLHIHVDHTSCMEVLILEGKNKEIEELSKKILATKGVEHGKLTLTSQLNKNKKEHIHPH